MKPSGFLRHAAIACILAVGFYAVLYAGIEYLRSYRGPWDVTFIDTPEGQPVIVVNQPKLGIKNVQIQLTGTNAALAKARQVGGIREPVQPLRQSFRVPRPVPFDVPNGQCVFMDTTFLPGTVSFVLAGHEIELLPRVLVIDRREHAWKSGAIIEVGKLSPAN